jgi:lipopolysaccharide transport system permease protein
MLPGTSAIIRRLENPPAETVVDADASVAHYWLEVWRYRELLRIFAWRDLTVRYRQAALGVLWAVGRPLLMAAIFSLVFGSIAGLSTGGPPYLLLVLAALLVWQMFAGAVQDAAQSLVSNAALVTKVYFPRVLAPAGAAAVSVVDALVSLVVLVVLSVILGVYPSLLALVAVSLVLAMTSGLALGVGLWLAALNVRYRDVRLVLPFLLQMGLYVSPVGFASDVIPDRWQPIFEANPLVSLIDACRFLLLGTAAPAPSAVAWTVAWTGASLGSGLWYFRRTERAFADVI